MHSSKRHTHEKPSHLPYLTSKAHIRCSIRTRKGIEAEGLRLIEAFLGIPVKRGQTELSNGDFIRTEETH